MRNAQRLRRVMLCVLSMCACASAVFAQQQAKPFIRVLDEAQRGNWLLRIEDSSGRTSQGRIANHTDTLVSIGRSVVDVRGVQRVLRGSRQGGGAQAAGIAGGVLLGGLAIAAYSACSGCDAEQVPIVLAIGALGAFIGAFIGEVTNPAHIVWKEVWP